MWRAAEDAQTDGVVIEHVVVSWRSAVYGGQRAVTVEDELYGWIPEQN
jgi:hypothetical protein